jgi:hypothetical protein
MYLKTLSKPAYNPLFFIGDTTYIFDHITDSYFIYDNSLNLFRSLFINYHYLEGWAKQLIVDEERQEVYAKFEKSGICYLKKIDLKAGSITKSYKLETHTYPTKIKIRDNIAYYLYQDHYNYGQMSVFMQGLY